MFSFLQFFDDVFVVNYDCVQKFRSKMPSLLIIIIINYKGLLKTSRQSFIFDASFVTNTLEDKFDSLVFFPYIFWQIYLIGIIRNEISVLEFLIHNSYLLI